jgi:hypothetical protein
MMVCIESFLCDCLFLLFDWGAHETTSIVHGLGKQLNKSFLRFGYPTDLDAMFQIRIVRKIWLELDGALGKVDLIKIKIQLKIQDKDNFLISLCGDFYPLMLEIFKVI